MNVQTATFGAGCFWGVESMYRLVPGVIDTAVGYAGGTKSHPTYQEVCADRTGHAEVVQIHFDPSIVTYEELVEMFFLGHDPTQLNRQGPDTGTQYRSVIFYHSPQQEAAARSVLQSMQKSGRFSKPIVTQIEPATTFWKAENYHQQYFEKQGVPAASCHAPPALPKRLQNLKPTVGTIMIEPPTSQPATCSPDQPNASCGTEHWKTRSDEEWQKILTPEQYRIARQASTEAPFTGKYWNTKTKGTYTCAACGQELFDSATKFDSGTGWPSFYQPIQSQAVSQHTDTSHGMTRVEVKCSRCDAHLGHLFDDGPRPTGLRYCINSAVLELKAK